MDPLVLKRLNVERHARRAAVLVTDLGDGRDQLVREGDKITGELGAAIEQVFKSGKSGTIEADGRSYFLNAHLPPPRLMIIGAVHICQSLVPMAKQVGFDLTIVDPRGAFATEERFPDTQLYADWPEDVLADHPLDAYSALVAITHDPKIDDLPLKAALDAGCFYIGALGSRKTHAKRVERLTAMGVSQNAIEEIRAPIGLNIGASNPAEIAVAIMAEIIDAFRSRGLSKSGGVHQGGKAA